jgi:hypothetical protein
MGTTWFAHVARLCLYNDVVRETGKHFGCNIRSDVNDRLYEQIKHAYLTSNATRHIVIARHPRTFKRRDEKSVRVWEAYYNVWASLALQFANVHLFQYEHLITSGCTARYADRRFVARYAKRYAVGHSTIAWRMWNYSSSEATRRTFLHMPRTGGLSAREERAYDTVWHDYRVPPPSLDSCSVYTSLRDPVRRYVSEWNFYGTFFAANKTVKGAKPALGFHNTLDSFLRDTSTHNTMTKLLSRCTLYDPRCVVDRSDVARIAKYVEVGCLKIVRSRKRVHVGTYGSLPTAAQLSSVAAANHLDVMLYKAIVRRRE